MGQWKPAKGEMRSHEAMIPSESVCEEICTRVAYNLSDDDAASLAHLRGASIERSAAGLNA